MCPYFYAGIDIGGTNIKAALTDEALKTLCTGSIPTISDPSDKSPETVLTRAASLIERMCSEQGLSMKGLKAIGIGMAGMVKSADAELLQFKVLGWNNLKPAKILEARFHVPVFLENDGTVNLIGETRLGAAVGYEDVILITLGTGVGGAIMTGGKLLGGALGLGGELGHIYIDQGKTFQQYCSATSIVGFARSKMEHYPDSLLWEESGHEPMAVTAKMIAYCAGKQDALCKSVMEEASVHLAYALTSFINVFNPALILIGGGLSYARDELLNPAIERALKSVHHPRLACDIRPACLGDLAGALGSCALAKLRTDP